MTKSAQGVVYGAPQKGALRRAANGRTCDHPACGTILSTYNAATTCFAHAIPMTGPPRPRA
jgi:hypothetical protein